MASLDTASPEGSCLKALAIALQHPAIATDQRNICMLLQVSKAWRTAVQQSAAGLTDINFSMDITQWNRRINTPFSFVGWLAKHSGLICNLKILPSFTGSAEFQAVEEVMQQLIERGLQAAAAQAVTAVAPNAANQVGRHCPYSLRSYSSSVPPTAAMLAALPAAMLTRLELHKVNNSDWYLGLSQLINLQQMRLRMDALHPAAYGCFIATSNLEMLTTLKLILVPRGLDTTLLPVQLKELDLNYGRHFPSTDPAPEANRGAVVDLQHLTRLRQLQLYAPELAAGSSVPCSLQYLKLSLNCWKAGSLSGLSSLNQVTSVDLWVMEMDSQQLEPFKQLAQLQRLSLIVYVDSSEVANGWGDLPLCDLKLWHAEGLPYSDAVQLMQRIGQATTLTKLDLDLPNVNPDYEGAEELAVCEHLSTLTNLKELVFNVGRPERFVEHDAQHLAALTTLTSLVCPGRTDGVLTGPSIDAITLCLLAEKLTNLRVLRVREDMDYVHEVGSTAALHAIGRLTTLEVLCVENLPKEAAQQGLRLLTDLKKLTQLKGFNEAGDEALHAFCNSIR